MNYARNVAKAIIPRKPHDILWVSVLCSLFVWAGYQTLLQAPPRAIVNTETQWPKSVPRGGYFYLNFDITFDKSCTIKARRFILASDGVEYLAQEDEKSVEAGERLKYTVTVPVAESLPIGSAFVRSQFTYECDFWSRWVRSLTQGGRARRFEITEAGTQPTYSKFACSLKPKPGYIVVRSYYRRDPRTVAQNE